MKSLATFLTYLGLATTVISLVAAFWMHKVNKQRKLNKPS